MATLNLTTAGQYTISGQAITVGALTVPVQLTYDKDLVCTRSIILAANTSGVLLSIGSAATDDIESIDGCIIYSDKEVGIQLEASVADGVANNSTFVLGAGQYVVLTDAQIYTYNAAGNFGTTTKVNIATIRARNELGAASSATVRIWAFT